MSLDVEDLLRRGMERFAEQVPVPAGLARRAARDRRRRATRTVVACGIAAVTAAVTLVVVSGAAARPGGGAAQARLTAYVTKRVENALASEGLVFVGRSGNQVSGEAVTWAYGAQSRYEEFTSNSCGQELANLSCTGRGGPQPFMAEGTAIVGGKLVSAYVTYFNHRYSLWPLRPQSASTCPAAGLGMAAPIFPTTRWRALIDTTLACGAASVTGHVRVNGVETTQITGKPITVRLQPDYAKTVNEKWATARWTLYVNPTTYLPVRIYGSTETFGGSAGSHTSSNVTNVQWLPPTRANVTQTLVTIPRGFHRFYGQPGDQA
jgi:urease accessory protein UreF